MTDYGTAKITRQGPAHLVRLPRKWLHEQQLRKGDSLWVRPSRGQIEVCHTHLEYGRIYIIRGLGRNNRTYYLNLSDEALKEIDAERGNFVAFSGNDDILEIRREG